MASRYSFTGQLYPWFNGVMREVAELPAALEFRFKHIPLVTLWRNSDHVTIRCTGTLTDAQFASIKKVIQWFGLDIGVRRVETEAGRWGPVFGPMWVSFRRNGEWVEVPFENGMTIPSGRRFIE